MDPDHASSAASRSTSSPGSSFLGIGFGAMSSIMSACHAVLIKRGLVRHPFLSCCAHGSVGG